MNSWFRYGPRNLVQESFQILLPFVNLCYRRQKEVLKVRVHGILEYLETVQEFLNLDGYLTLAFTQSGQYGYLTEFLITLQGCFWKAREILKLGSS